MVEEINKKYRNFADGLIHKVTYEKLVKGVSTENIAHITIRCINVENELWEVIRLRCKDVSSFRFFENEKTCSTVINSALLKRERGKIIFDFFPIFYAPDNIIEDPNSDFSIQFKEIEYEVIEYPANDSFL